VGWGCIAINLAQPLVLVLMGAFVAGLMMTLYSAHVFYVNRKFLPRELQAPLWRQLLLLVMSAFFGILTLVVILQRVFGIRVGWL
jgi:TRAP-type C4-dicarboxylate transport system permease large subunit